jgi:single-strand DNA-binding protein
MNSFTLTAVGQLARNPELVAKGNTAYTRFCLVGNDYAGKDEEGAAREVVTSLWFVAFGALGEAIARNSRKGDQLFIEARVRASNWTDKQGGKQYDHSFVVQGFRFGAPGRTKREERDARREDGHGLQRSEERANGRDRSANNGAYLSLGGSSGVVSHAADAPGADLRTAKDSGAAAAEGTVGGANEPVSGNEDVGVNTNTNTNAESDPSARADLGTAATIDPTVRGNDDAGANEVAGAGGGANPVASGTTKDGARRVAGAGASRASEKTSGGRSSRRAAASAA